jgi:Leucine-rich repeat (LRR) protein
MNLRLEISLVYVFLILPFVVVSQNPTPQQITDVDSIKIKRQKQMARWEVERAEREAKARAAFIDGLDKLNPDSVTLLNMQNLGLTELPDLSRFYRLKKINASGNKIKHFRKRDFISDSLTTVVLSDNPVKRVCFPAGSRIQNVVMQNCNLKRVPCSVKKLKHIRSLDFTKNRIKRIPRYVKNRQNLKEINFNFNRIKFNGRVVNRTGGIGRVLLAGNHIEKLPENTGSMTGVRKLNLADNMLSELPVSFGELDSLETVIFYKNRFRNIPQEIFEIPQLKEMDFYYNNIDKLPDEFNRLVHLKRVYLSYNNLTSLPKSLAGLKELEFIYVHHNNLSFIPGWITELPVLSVLDAGYNNLISVPDLSKMATLKEVDLQSNNLEDIPWELLVKPGIKRVFLRNNPFIKEGDDLIKLQKLVKKRASEGVNIYID